MKALIIILHLGMFVYCEIVAKACNFVAHLVTNVCYMSIKTQFIIQVNSEQFLIATIFNNFIIYFNSEGLIRT